MKISRLTFDAGIYCFTLAELPGKFFKFSKELPVILGDDTRSYAWILEHYEKSVKAIILESSEQVLILTVKE
jgi:hypothetical protein